MSEPAFLNDRGRPRVAVTGLGVKTPAGTDVEGMWATVLAAAECTAAPIERFDASELPVRFAGEVRDFDATTYVGPKEARRQDRVTQLGFAAAVDALADAGELGTDPSRCAVIAATGVGGLESMEINQQTFMERGASRVSPFVTMMMPNATVGAISINFGWTGPNMCIATACAAGTHAIGEGARLIRDGTADAVVAGGCEAGVTPLTISAFARMGALSVRNDDPPRASRPFDVDRDGFVMSEGAAFVILEPLERAIARGATVYGIVSGYGRNADAHHITAPSPGGAGAAACMQLALEDAGISAASIGHVNAHGTSTPLNDASEAEALRKVFGDHAPPVTSTKGVTGHVIGAAGAAEAVIALLSIRDGIVPPTANLQKVSDEIELDIVYGEPRAVGHSPVLSNSFGFGGHNATLILAPPDPHPGE